MCLTFGLTVATPVAGSVLGASECPGSLCAEALIARATSIRSAGPRSTAWTLSLPDLSRRVTSVAAAGTAMPGRIAVG